jgi:hypothetical protein
MIGAVAAEELVGSPQGFVAPAQNAHLFAC